MAYEKKVFGKMPDGTAVEEYILTNSHGVSASFLTLGAIWSSMIVPDHKGHFDDILLGNDSVERCLHDPAHHGEVIGRNANRIGGASFVLNKQTYLLSSNDGKNNLHSGTDFYRNRIWESEIIETSLGTKVRFNLNSPDLDQGYPGNAAISVCYTLTEDDSIIIDYYLLCDQDTIANLTNHAYFNLAGHHSLNAMDQQVWIDADYFTATDSASIPTGTLRAVEGTPMDFRVLKAIALEIDADDEQLRWAGGYDHNWVLNHPVGELSLSAKAIDAKSGRVLTVFTDLPGIQFYTGNFLSSECVGKQGVRYHKRAGYCFETQYFPDAVNQLAFPSPVLKAGEEYQTTTIYQFSCQGN